MNSVAFQFCFNESDIPQHKIKCSPGEDWSEERDERGGGEVLVSIRCGAEAVTLTTVTFAPCFPFCGPNNEDRNPAHTTKPACFPFCGPNGEDMNPAHTRSACFPICGPNGEDTNPGQTLS